MGRQGDELHSQVKLPVLPASLDIGLPEVGEHGRFSTHADSLRHLAWP